jgi:hypothetical protein
MAMRTEVECLSVAYDGLLKILYLVQLRKTNGKRGGEVIETGGAIWMAGGAKSETLVEVCDGLLQILHLSQHFEALIKSYSQIIRHISTLEIIWRAQLKVLSTVRNCAVLHSGELASHTPPVTVNF